MSSMAGVSASTFNPTCTHTVPVVKVLIGTPCARSCPSTPLRRWIARLAFPTETGMLIFSWNLSIDLIQRSR